MTKPFHISLRQAAGALAVASLVFAIPATAAVPLKEVVRDYGADSALAPLDKTFQMALLENGWIPLAATEGDITAATSVRGNYAKVRIRFGDGKATFTLMDASGLDSGPCDLWINDAANQTHVDACVHPVYYQWLESIMNALPVARAKVLLLQSVINPGGSKP